ncbi:MAG TPA: hypothetical protein VI643_02785 [Planctomycetota bacterium]|nr:hypothetical protein [Planctomycetota bacterium]
MLRINLLPPERRRLRRTPIYALLPLALGVFLAAGSLALAAYFYVEMTIIEDQLRETDAQIESKKHVRAQHAQLTADLAGIREEVRNITTIVNQGRPEWAEILGAIVEVSSKNPHIWFEKVDILSATAASAALRRFSPQANVPTTFGVQLDCNSAPEKVLEEGKASYIGNPELIFKFREELRMHPTLRNAFKEMQPINPDWQLVSDQGSVEGFKLKFSVYLIAVKK